MNIIRVHKIVRWMAWLAAGVFIVALVICDIGPTRRIVVAARFDRATPRASVFGPPSRVELASDSVRVVGEPVYVNIRLPRWYRSVVVEVAYENISALPVRFGVRTDATAWTYDLRDAPFPDDAGLVTARETFTLERSWQVERNLFQFILAAPGASAERPIVIRSFRIIAQRDPLCLGRFCV